MMENSGSGTAGTGPLSPELLAKMNAYWRAANYLSMGQIYLKGNPRLAAQADADALTY
jgi:phosphoketolase